MIFGLYRAPTYLEHSVLPWVYMSPKPDTVLAPADKLYVYCNPVELRNAMNSGGLDSRIVWHPDGTGSLSSEPPLGTMPGAKQSQPQSPHAAVGTAAPPARVKSVVRKGERKVEKEDESDDDD